MYQQKFLVILFFLLPYTAHAWGLHYLVTDSALTRFTKTNLEEEIPSEPLEAFLKDQGIALAKTFDGYYDWLKNRGSKRFIRQIFNYSQPSVVNFLKAARLNPKTQFFYTNRVMPQSQPKFPLIPFPTLTPYEKLEKNFTFVFEDVTGKNVKIRSILNTYSDEPDWWIDGHLWDYPEYGYGKSPYGKSNGNSNAAAFHTQFAHENWIVRTFAPEMQDGMALERLELTKRLAQLAFRSGHPYWGYRFSAWGIHYIEDLCQPYHSKAIPHADFVYYLKFVFSSNKEQIKNDSTQLVINRHLLYEDFVKYVLQVGPANHDNLLASIFTQIKQSFLEGELRWQDLLYSADSKPLFDRVATASSELSYGLDRAVVKAYGPKMTEDPQYDFENDKTYDALAVFKESNAGNLPTLIAEAEKDLELTGIATRTLLESYLVGGAVGR